MSDHHVNIQDQDQTRICCQDLHPSHKILCFKAIRMNSRDTRTIMNKLLEGIHAVDCRQHDKCWCQLFNNCFLKLLCVWRARLSAILSGNGSAGQRMHSWPFNSLGWRGRRFCLLILICRCQQLYQCVLASWQLCLCVTIMSWVTANLRVADMEKTLQMFVTALATHAVLYLCTPCVLVFTCIRKWVLHPLNQSGPNSMVVIDRQVTVPLSLCYACELNVIFPRQPVYASTMSNPQICFTVFK